MYKRGKGESGRREAGREGGRGYRENMEKKGTLGLAVGKVNKYSYYGKDGGPQRHKKRISP